MPELPLRLLTFILIGVIVWALARRFPMEGYGPQKVEAFDRRFLMIALVMVAVVDQAFGSLSASLASGLYEWAAPARQYVAGWSITTQVIFCLLVSDFLGYWVHRLMHTEAFWRIHAFHHSAESLNWFSGMRSSPLHVVLILAPGALIAALFLLTESRWAFLILLLIDVFNQHLTHSNLRLPFVRQLEWLLVTPRMHFVHHRRDEACANSNYGFYFAIWDHIFGTYIDSADLPNKGLLGLSRTYTKKSMFLGLNLTETPPDGTPVGTQAKLNPGQDVKF